MAAIDWGADAIYMGGPGFGARHAAGNSVADISRVVEYARQYGVRVYVTLNTLLFEDELPVAEKLAREVVAAGVDALIIQDMAYLEMGLQGVEFHASTQTFNATPEKVRFLQAAGFSRAILERGISLDDIRAIRASTDIELECFVHGAICVGYSGRCWLSRTMSDRSGNRGQCSQPCRQTYDLVDDRGNVLIKSKHLLSVQDLDLSARIGELLDAGVTSFKIEGRLKDVNYVRNTVGCYRRRIDEELSSRTGLTRASVGHTVSSAHTDLSKTFTRGRSEYFFTGKHKGVASFDTPKAIGNYVGKVARVGDKWFETDSKDKFSPGDGICFILGGELTGTNINGVDGRRIIPNRMDGITPGVKVYRNYDHSFTQQLEKSNTRRVIDVSATVKAGGDMITLELKSEDGAEVSVSHSATSGAARDRGKMVETLRLQISRSGDTIFRMAEVRIEAGADVPFVPVSEINALRREGLDRLAAARLTSPPTINVGKEEPSFPYPVTSLAGDENVTNSLAERFCRRHGVTGFAPQQELAGSMSGLKVLRTPYCIRRETGECLKSNPKNNGPLFLEHGNHRYRLEFDCGKCEMNLVYEP